MVINHETKSYRIKFNSIKNVLMLTEWFNLAFNCVTQRMYSLYKNIWPMSALNKGKNCFKLDLCSLKYEDLQKQMFERLEPITDTQKNQFIY